MEKSSEVIKKAVELCRAVTGLEMTTFNLHGSLSGAVALPLSSVSAIESKSAAESKSDAPSSSSAQQSASATTVTSKDSAVSNPGQTGNKDTIRPSSGS